MKVRTRKEFRLERYARRLLIFSFILFAVGIVFLNSYESTINVAYNKTEKEINTVQSNIDALDMEKQELVSFSRVRSIANNKGYSYKQSSVATTVVGESD